MNLLRLLLSVFLPAAAMSVEFKSPVVDLALDKNWIQAPGDDESQVLFRSDKFQTQVTLSWILLQGVTQEKWKEIGERTLQHRKTAEKNIGGEGVIIEGESVELLADKCIVKYHAHDVDHRCRFYGIVKGNVILMFYTETLGKDDALNARLHNEAIAALKVH